MIVAIVLAGVAVVAAGLATWQATVATKVCPSRPRDHEGPVKIRLTRPGGREATAMTSHGKAGDDGLP